jgi:hypothetical protein
MGLELEESEDDADVGVGGFSKKGWLPSTDVSGFRSILFEIVIDHPAMLLGVSNDQAKAGIGVPVFVSEMIAADQSPSLRKRQSFHGIFNILKKNGFAIVPGVDSVDVLSFVNWVESFE